MIRTAEISECGRYRYKLSREWDDLGFRRVCFVMLNPSIADSEVDDPTIRKCIGFARRWRFGALDVVNLYAYRATNPRDLPKFIVDPLNVSLLHDVAYGGPRVVLAWGASVPDSEHARAVAKMFVEARVLGDLWCLGRTKEGHPRHPLMLAYSTPLEAFGGYQS